MAVLVEVHGHHEDQVDIADTVDWVYDFALPPLVLHTIYTRDATHLKRWIEIRPRNAVTVLDTSPGVDQRGAERLVAAWGTDMQRLGTASRLSAWTGVAPGNDESAGKRRAGKTRQGNRVLRTG